MLVPDKGDYTQVRSTPKGAKSPTPGTRPRTKRPARRAEHTALPRCRCRAGCTSPGRTTTLCVWTPIPARRRAFSVSARPRRRTGRPRGRDSVAIWGGTDPRDRRDGQGGPATDDEGNLLVARDRRDSDYLKVTTTRMRPGYLQKNGVPYGANALLEEHFDLASDPYTKNTWLLVTTVVTDAQYLNEPLIMQSHFKSCRTPRGGIPRRAARTSRVEGDQMRSALLLYCYWSRAPRRRAGRSCRRMGSAELQHPCGHRRLHRDADQRGRASEGDGVAP